MKLEATGVLLVAAVLLRVHSFNLDLQHPLIYESAQRDAFFGYSVALRTPPKQSSQRSWLLVGAPKVGENQLGAVYRCYIKSNCTALRFNFEEPLVGLRKSTYNYTLHRALLGSAIDVMSQRYVVCSPNWEVNFVNELHPNMYGACFLGDAEKSTQQFVMPLAPEDGNRAKDTMLVNNITFPNYKWGQAGFSAHLSADAQGAFEVVLGAPAVGNTKGTTVYYTNRSLQKGGFGDQNSAGGKPRTSVLDSRFLREYNVDGFLGYAVTAGNYFSNSGTYSVAGAPTANLTGLVYAFADANQQDASNRQVKHLVSGLQGGEYFGAALATGDVNKDGLDDLLVGAPFFSDLEKKSDSQNEGRVFVFLGDFKQKFVKPKVLHEIKGSAYNGRFGSAIACLGDLDHDGFKDFAIGAPFEASGVVYIYRGGVDGLVASQKIVGSALYAGVAGFGFSISRGQDVDGNGYNDVAIGAYKSGHAFIIRAKPVVKLHPSVQMFQSALSNQMKNFTAEFCVEYSGGNNNVPAALDVNMVVTLDAGYERIRSDNFTNVVTTTLLKLNHLRKLCNPYVFYLKETINNYLELIVVKAEFSLAASESDGAAVHAVVTRGNNSVQGEDKFCSRCAVLLRQDSDVQVAKIGFALGCRDENNCLAQLRVQMQFWHQQNEAEVSSLVVGSVESVALKVNVSNAGDPAHNTVLSVTLASVPDTMPAGCKLKLNASSQIECQVTNPLRRAAHQVFLFVLDAQKAAGDVIEASASIKSASNTSDLNLLSAQVALPLSFEAAVQVYGQAQQEYYNFGSLLNENDKINASVSIQVEKKGFSPLDEVVLKVAVPIAFDGNVFVKMFEPKFRINMEDLVCEWSHVAELDSKSFHNLQRSNESDDALVIECSSGEWRCSHLLCTTALPHSNIAANLNLPLQIDTSPLESKLGARTEIVFKLSATVEIVKPSGVLHPANVPRREGVSVRIVLRRGAADGQIEAWVIIVALLAALALFGLMLFALHKAGFFKRPHKEIMQSLVTKEAPQGEVAEEQSVESWQTKRHSNL